jgi:hypothetical protein
MVEKTCGNARTPERGLPHTTATGPIPSPVALPPALHRPRLRRWEAAEYLELVHGLRFAPATLAKYASIGGGPSFHKVNGTPLYPKLGENGLDDWAVKKLGHPVRSTSELRK